MNADPYWTRFPPVGSASPTDLCGSCGHCRDRHGFTGAALCLVLGCPCPGGADWRVACHPGGDL